MSSCSGSICLMEMIGLGKIRWLENHVGRPDARLRLEAKMLIRDNRPIGCPETCDTELFVSTVKSEDQSGDPLKPGEIYVKGFYQCFGQIGSTVCHDCIHHS